MLSPTPYQSTDPGCTDHTDNSSVLPSVSSPATDSETGTGPALRRYREGLRSALRGRHDGAAASVVPPRVVLHLSPQRSGPHDPSDSR